jgi:hypothetical protein
MVLNEKRSSTKYIHFTLKKKFKYIPSRRGDLSSRTRGVHFLNWRLGGLRRNFSSTRLSSRVKKRIPHTRPHRRKHWGLDRRPRIRLPIT